MDTSHIIELRDKEEKKRAKENKKDKKQQRKETRGERTGNREQMKSWENGAKEAQKTGGKNGWRELEDKFKHLHITNSEVNVSDNHCKNMALF